MLGIDSQAQRQVDGLVELGELYSLKEHDRVLQRVLTRLNRSARLRYVFSVFLHLASLSPTRRRYVAGSWLFATRGLATAVQNLLAYDFDTHRTRGALHALDRRLQRCCV